MSQQQQPSNSNNNINTNLYLSSLLQDDTHQDHNATSTNSNTSRKRSYSTDQALDGGEEEGDVSEKKERKGRKAPHELLTDAEKKANHIASEKKRRQNIRLGFDQLIEIVPSLTQGNRSEAFILQKSVDHIRHLINVKNDLKSQIRDLQGVLGEA
ncbi:helix-loop-helix DNA-binding domain-containing transcription factor [Mucor lusitanicus]|uniref:Helix-loop-helix DNA-binding domain-containing transcription factor n=1 Tax=Mucor lusitanicus CBS 277.49 TaxID=747725 RepID=A0A168MBL7_MUCCL|nr:helix-loop-helix DNA-binding domain-containing transcription factor [Mucor lusitanicus CBS 277.49]